MKTLAKSLLFILLGSIASSAAAQEKFLHIYQTEKDETTEWVVVGIHPNTGQEIWNQITKVFGRFDSYPLSVIDSISFTTRAADGYQRMKVRHHTDGKSGVKNIGLPSISHWTIGPDVPKFRINTTTPSYTEVPDKENYLDGTLTIEGLGVYDDFTGDVKIRGRGNSTWNMSKKPYRLKFPVKTKICGYRKAKNYVLLANHIDMSFMRNEVAALATQYAGMPFPLHATPVDVYFNDIYKGSYMLIEKVGINNGSVNMPAAQEAESCMFQIDVSYDEDYKVKTPVFNLPLMHKDPDLPEDKSLAEEWFEGWCKDFYEMESAVASGTNVANYLDYTTLAQYLLVYNLAANQELNHPKSVFMYKTRGGKWTFGPCWDFDWAFGYSPTYRAESADGYSKEEMDRMFNEAMAIAQEKFGTPETGGWGFFNYNGTDLLYTGYELLAQVGNTYVRWPYQAVSFEPSYCNYLLGVGKNNSGLINGDSSLGNGGEFFLSIIKDNPEFMAEYKRVWDEFSANIDAFWADFEAYAKTLEPSAARNFTAREFNLTYDQPVDTEFADVVDSTYLGAINQLRLWVKKRLEFIGDPAHNYGLYDPQLQYERGTIPSK